MTFRLQDKQLRKQLAAFYRPSTVRSVGALLEEWFAIILLAWLSCRAFDLGGMALGVLVYIITALIIASRQRALENLIHESTHYNLSKNKFLNDGLTWLFAAVPLFHHVSCERQSHCIGHHKNFWDIDKDPDYKRYQLFGMDNLQFNSVAGFVAYILGKYPRYYVSTLWAFFLPKQESTRSTVLRLIPWVIVGVLAYTYNIVDIVVLYWFAPFFIVLPIIRYLGEITEHAGFACTTEELTSTRNNLGFFNEVFLHPRGDAYHLVHHLFPRIPYNRVKHAHALLLHDEAYRLSGRHVTSFSESLADVANVNR